MYAADFDVPAGSYEFKVTINGSWDENYGQGGAPGGANIPLVLEGDAELRFIYDPTNDRGPHRRHRHRCRGGLQRFARRLCAGPERDERVRMNTVSLATTAFAQSPSFWHAGADLLRSKSLDRNSYNSGDWFNRIDWGYDSSTFGSGLPPRQDNEGKWGYMRPLLADPALKPGHDDLDSRWERVVVVFNATPDAQAVDIDDAAAFELHPVQASGSDDVIKHTEVSASSVTVPGRTVAVLVQD